MYPGVNYHPVKSDAPSKPSPTWGYKAHDQWASRQLRALTAIHEIVKPTHWATVKLNQPLPLDSIRRFQVTVSKAIEYQNKQTGQHIAIYAVPEIDGESCVHYHILIRAYNIDPAKLLNGVISKFNRKNGTIISLDYIEPPESSDAVTLYSLKLGKRDTLLFLPGSLNRYTFTAGRYFLNFKIDDLREQSLNEWLFRQLECEADKLVGDW
jgi:hypothetical protein